MQLLQQPCACVFALKGGPRHNQVCAYSKYPGAGQRQHNSDPGHGFGTDSQLVEDLDGGQLPSGFLQPLSQGEQYGSFCLGPRLLARRPRGPSSRSPMARIAYAVLAASCGRITGLV